MVKQSELKKLAEWYGYDIQLYSKDSVDWQPHKDSNQLDMLEDKMIEEAGYYAIAFNKKDNGWVCSYMNPKTIEGTIDNGKTKNEARLNAIVNYIEGIMNS